MRESEKERRERAPHCCRLCWMAGLNSASAEATRPTFWVTSSWRCGNPRELIRIELPRGVWTVASRESRGRERERERKRDSEERQREGVQRLPGSLTLGKMVIRDAMKADATKVDPQKKRRPAIRGDLSPHGGLGRSAMCDVDYPGRVLPRSAPIAVPRLQRPVLLLPNTDQNHQGWTLHKGPRMNARRE